MISEGIIKNSDLFKDSVSLKDNDDENKFFSNDEESDDYYDNFYN